MWPTSMTDKLDIYKNLNLSDLSNVLKLWQICQFVNDMSWPNNVKLKTSIKDISTQTTHQLLNYVVYGCSPFESYLKTFQAC